MEKQKHELLEHRQNDRKVRWRSLTEQINTNRNWNKELNTQKEKQVQEDQNIDKNQTQNT